MNIFKKTLALVLELLPLPRLITAMQLTQNLQLFEEK